MSSSTGADVTIYAAKEASPNTLPANPVWQIIRRTSDSLKKTPELTQSGEIVNSVFEQGSALASATAAGAINFVFSALSQDIFLEGVSRNTFVVDSADEKKSTLAIGGDGDLASFTIVKHDRKLDRIEVFTGVRITELTITATVDGAISGVATIMATGYETPTQLPVTGSPEATTTTFTTGLNIKAFTLNDVPTAGTACAESFEIKISNNAEAKGCIGSGSALKSRLKIGKVSTALTSTVLLTEISKQWISKVESRERMTAAIEILDNKNNSYVFGFSKLELDNDGLSDTTLDDEHTLSLEFKHVEEAMTVTRTLV